MDSFEKLYFGEYAQYNCLADMQDVPNQIESVGFVVFFIRGCNNLITLVIFAKPFDASMLSPGRDFR